ncbi:MAG: hypothetical protein WCX48_10580 [Bacteroidales bacterium]
MRKDKKTGDNEMQKIERDTLHRIADELTVKKYDSSVELSKNYWFSKWAAEFSHGDEDIEQRLFDEDDAMTGLMYDLATKYGIEVYQE